MSGVITEGSSAGAPPPVFKGRPSRVRHAILGLTVIAYMITYMDRVVISTTAPLMQEEFGFSAITMGWIFSIFQIGYAMFQIPGGWLGDRFGTRRVLSGIVVWWSVFTALTTAAWSAGSMLAVRFLFGCGEAGAFPNATRALSRWLLPSERGFAQGVTHAGARLGAAVTPVLVVWLMLHLGWRGPFLIFAVLGILWAAAWFWFYRDNPEEHEGANEGERELIARSLGRQNAASARPSVPWRRLVTSPQLWLLSAMYFCYAYSINIFLTWFPTYLNDERSFDLAQMGLYASVPLFAGVLGDMSGGWISDRLLLRSGQLKMARRVVAITGFLIAAIAIPIAVLADSPLESVGWFALAVFGLELTVGISWAVTLDIGGMFAGSVSAVMNTFGNIGGALAAVATGYVLSLAGWNPAFYILSVLSVIAALLFLRIDASRPLYEPAPE